MDCRTAEGMVSSYIKHDLPLNELEEFLDHVQNCSSCYDELETYFIVHEVTQQLDDDSSDSVLDFKKLLEPESYPPALFSLLPVHALSLSSFSNLLKFLLSSALQSSLTVENSIINFFSKK